MHHHQPLFPQVNKPAGCWLLAADRLHCWLLTG